MRRVVEPGPDPDDMGMVPFPDAVMEVHGVLVEPAVVSVVSSEFGYDALVVPDVVMAAVLADVPLGVVTSNV